MALKAIVSALLIAMLFSLGGCVQQPPTQPGNGQEPPGNGQETPISLSELALHSIVSDCWLAIDGKVYGVTAFVSQHPGGSAILQGCGKDATMLFETRPMGSGTPHSENARAIRENYYIGILEG
jgi:L-lactate dehydrogenase (cytochrome)